MLQRLGLHCIALHTLHIYLSASEEIRLANTLLETKPHKNFSAPLVTFSASTFFWYHLYMKDRIK